MKTQTRQKNLWLRTALLLPLIGLLAYSCAEHKTEYVQEVAMLDEVSNVKIIDLNVLADNQLEYNQAIISVEQLPQIIKNEKYTTAALNVSPLVDVAFAKSVVATLVEMGVSKKMSVCTATEDGASLTKEDFNEIMSPLSGLYAKNNSTQISDETGTILVDGVLHFYVSKGDKIDYYDRWGNLVDVTGKTLTEKKMKTTTERVLKGQDSNIPPPPQSSKSVSQQFQETGTVEVDGEIHFFITQNKKTTYYNRWGNLIDVTGKSLTNKVLKSSTRKVRKGEASDIPPPPNPPTPPVVSTDKLDQVIRLAKEYAAFSYEGNPITSDKAIALIKENKSLYILVRRFKNSNPIVDITEDKVTFIENANGWKAPNDMSPSESPTKDPASVLEPYIKKNATFFIDKKPATPEEAKKLMRSDRGANLKIRTTKEGKTIVMIQGC